MKVCVVTDNEYIFGAFTELLARKPIPDCEFDFYYTSWNRAFAAKYGTEGAIRPVRLKEEDETFFSRYDMFMSLHCKQLFPAALVENHPCVNVHPGYNPYNRGWFPQVFGIMNHLPIGATIHRMDARLDHGDILYQETLKLEAWETSKDVYLRILALEMQLVEAHLSEIVHGTAPSHPMESEGNMNEKKDFDRLCEIDRTKPATYGEVIDYLRAMTFAPYNNAYFYDEDGNKIFVGITLQKEERE